MNIEIIAEIAQGFEGSKDQAKLLVTAAAKSGANAAKFQLVYADELSTPDYEHYKLFSGLEMEDQDWLEIKELCDSLNIELILDVFGYQGLNLSEKLNIKSIKLHATDINNLGFLGMVSKSSIERVMLGVGGALLSEIETALQILDSKEVILFHGFQGYPTLIESNQMSRIEILKNSFSSFTNIKYGFSDHVDPNDVTSVSLPSFALGLGVTILEKHLTLGRCMELEDHEAALNPDQFKVFSRSIKDIVIAQGKSSSADDFNMSDSEKSYRKAVRRHVVARRDIKSNEILSDQDIVLKRTSKNNAITKIKEVYGLTAIKDIQKNQAITSSDIK